MASRLLKRIDDWNGNWVRPRKSERGKRNALNRGYEWFSAVEKAVCFKSGFPILRFRFKKVLWCWYSSIFDEVEGLD